MDREKLRAELVRDEGVVLHAYQDHLGFLTVGVGRLIDPRRGGGISHEEAMLLLDHDIAAVIAGLDANIGWWRSLSDGRQRALVNLGFQLGVRGLLGFRKTLAALHAGDFEGAAREALDSRWAVQTPARATRITRLIRGEDI